MRTLFFTTLAVTLLASGVWYFVLAFRLSFQVARRGHRSPLMKFAVGFYLLVGWMGAFFLSMISGDPLMESNQFTYRPTMIPGAFEHLGLRIVLPVLVWGGMGVAIVRVLPKIHRRGGHRQARFPWRVAGWILLVAYPIVAILLWRVTASAWNLYKPFPVFIGGALYCFDLARRASAAGLEEVLVEDPRPPTLYLRSFLREAEVFAELRTKELEKYSQREKYSLYKNNQLGATLEQYLSADLAARIGPLIALGSPDDYLPPEGAARAYMADEDWQSSFVRLAERAACIVMEVDQSENLRWELAHLRKENLQRKLFVLTPPAPIPGWRFALGRKFVAWRARVNGIEARSWPRFVQMLTELGYQVALADPGLHAVIAFDEMGQEVRLSAGVGKPEEIVDVIASRLAPSES